MQGPAVIKHNQGGCCFPRWLAEEVGKSSAIPRGVDWLFFPPPSQVQRNPLGSLAATELQAGRVVWSCWGRQRRQRYPGITPVLRSHLPPSQLITPLDSGAVMPASRRALLAPDCHLPPGSRSLKVWERARSGQVMPVKELFSIWEGRNDSK